MKRTEALMVDRIDIDKLAGGRRHRLIVDLMDDALGFEELKISMTC